MNKRPWYRNVFWGLIWFVFSVELTAQDGLNGALQFGGAGSRLAFKAASIPPPWTAEMWVRRHDAAGSSAPLFIGSAGALKLEQFGTDRQVGLTAFGEGDHAFEYVAPAGQWVHLAFVADQDVTRLYVNGVERDLLGWTIALPLDYFGSSPQIPGDQLEAEVDEIRVWDVARTQVEVAANFQRAVQGNEPGLVGSWRCDELRDGITPDQVRSGWVGAGLGSSVGWQRGGATLDPVLVLSRRELRVPENGRGLLGVHLSGPPSSNWVVRMQRVSGDPDLRLGATSSLTFGLTNWQDDQLFEILAAPDTDAADGEATFSVTATGGAGATVVVRELDASVGVPVHMDVGTVPALWLEGPLHSVYTVEFNSDFANRGGWQFLTNVVVTGGGGWWVDLAALGSSRRFYRAALQPFRLGTNLDYIPPGSFMMGTPRDEAERDEGEVAHRVNLTRGFWMGRFEVTQDEYYRVVGTRPSARLGGNRPAETVTWLQAKAYCALLTEQERAAGNLPRGWSYRLPTEAEWEYACRAGTTTPFGLGPDLLAGMAAFNGAGEYRASVGTVENPAWVEAATTVEVGRYAPNAWGLYDMHGNVMEWCLDSEAPYPAGTVSDPCRREPGNLQRAARGGSFYFYGRFARSAARVFRWEAGALDDLGFRVVLAPTDPEMTE